LKTEDDRFELRIIVYVWELGMEIALRKAGDDGDDRAEAGVEAVQLVCRRSQATAFSSSVNICVGTFGRFRPRKKLAMTWVAGEAARRAIAETISVAVP
jgi:hypothetical protein